MKKKYSNKFIEKIIPYSSASHRIWDSDAKDKSKIFKLDWNESTEQPSPKVKERIISLANKGDFYNLYPLTENKLLKSLLSKYLELPEENLQYFAGSDYIHEYISKVYLEKEDRVLILSPSYDNFRLTIESSGAKPFFSEVEEDFKFRMDSFKKDIEKINPRLIYICNPNNPLGYIIPSNKIEELLVNYPETLFVIDEAYVEFSKRSCKELVRKYKNILITRTMSKAFALANFRLGYLISSKENIEEISKIRNPKNISTFAQEAAIGALSDIKFMEEYVEEVINARTIFLNFLEKYELFLNVYQSEANFVLIKFKDSEIKEKFIKFLLNREIYIRNLKHRPILVNCVRITIGTKVKMEEVSKIIDKFFMQQLKDER